MRENRPLLIVEDSDEDFEVTCWALRQSGFTRPIIRCTRADEALLRLCPPRQTSDWNDPPPCLVLLDLNLPGMNARQLLQELQQSAQAPGIPVVVLSSSTNPRDIAACYRLGASGYLFKPLGLDSYVEKMRALTRYWFDAVTLPEETA